MRKNIILLVLCIGMIFGLTGCGDNTSKTGNNTATGTNGSKNEYTPSELEKNLVTSGAVVGNGDLVVFIKNNNGISVGMNIEVEFYDKKGVIVGSEKDFFNAVRENSEIAARISSPKSFDTYKIYVDVKQSDYISYYDYIEITHNNTKEHVAVQVKNNSKEVIGSIYVAVVYYKNDKPVGIDAYMLGDTKSGRSANFEMEHPYDGNYNKLKFDKYKVFINEVSNY